MIDLSNISEERLSENDFGSTSDFAWGELKELINIPCHERHRIPSTWVDNIRTGRLETIQWSLYENAAYMNSFLTIYTSYPNAELPGLIPVGDERNLVSPTISEESVGGQTLRDSFRPDFWVIKRYMAHVTGVPIKKYNVSSFFEESLFVSMSVSNEVISEANQQNLMDDLGTAIALLNATFPMLHEIDVSIHHDPEILDRFTICFTLTVSGDIESILDCESLFKKRLFSQIDIDARPLLAFTYKFLE
jgi:hypothetical protein